MKCELRVIFLCLVSLFARDIHALASDFWTIPACQMVNGIPGVVFTKDNGSTISSTSQYPAPFSYTPGLVALDLPNVLLAEHGGGLYRSTDAGCNWNKFFDVQGSPLNLTAASAGIAYAWSASDHYVYRITSTETIAVRSGVPRIVGLGTEALRTAHIRLISDRGRILDSYDAGKTWKQSARLPSAVSVYTCIFDPKNIDHFLIGVADFGAYVTFDGGKHWTQSVGFSKVANSANIFSVVVSPANPMIVWATGIDLDKTFDGAGDEVGLYRSSNGGKTFRRMLHSGGNTGIWADTVMVPHPNNPNILHFAGPSPTYGQELYRFDYNGHTLSKSHPSIDEINSLVFSPADPSVLYVGFGVVGNFQ